MAQPSRSQGNGAPARHRTAPSGRLLLLALASLTACKPHAPQPAADTIAPDASAPRSLVSLKEVMDAVIDPAADGLWDSVATISTEKGVEQRAPRTDEEWKAVRRNAIQLLEGMNLTMLPGRAAAPRGATPGLGELPPKKIDAMISANRAEFDQYAQEVQKRTQVALAAIDRKDAKALFKIGSEIDSACESCHVRFWYPDLSPPGK